MTTCTIEHHRDGECIETWNVTEEMIQRQGDMARVVFPLGQIVLASYDELHFCLGDGLDVLSEAQRR
jgi:hypothetical protein